MFGNAAVNICRSIVCFCWHLSCCLFAVFAPPPPAGLSSAFGLRLANSLGDLYTADIEEDEKTPYSSAPPSSSSSVSLSPSPSSIAPPSLSCYGNGPRGLQHEVNNNGGGGALYGGFVAPPAGKSYVRPLHQDPFSGHRPYSAMKGPSGRYLSRSIPVSPLSQQQPVPAPFFSVVLSFVTSVTRRRQPSLKTVVNQMNWSGVFLPVCMFLFLIF